MQHDSMRRQHQTLTYWRMRHRNWLNHLFIICIKVASWIFNWKVFGFYPLVLIYPWLSHSSDTLFWFSRFPSPFHSSRSVSMLHYCVCQTQKEEITNHKCIQAATIIDNLQLLSTACCKFCNDTIPNSMLRMTRMIRMLQCVSNSNWQIFFCFVSFSSVHFYGVNHKVFGHKCRTTSMFFNKERNSIEWTMTTFDERNKKKGVKNKRKSIRPFSEMRCSVVIHTNTICNCAQSFLSLALCDLVNKKKIWKCENVSLSFYLSIFPFLLEFYRFRIYCFYRCQP